MTKTKAQKQRAKEARALQPKKAAGKGARGKRAPRNSDNGGRIPNRNGQQLGAVVGPNFMRLGVADIRRCRVAWVLGYTFVGSAADGVANSVYFTDNTQTLIVGGKAYSAGSGWVPIAGSDTKLGATYVSDLQKHFARRIVHRMKVRVESLNPSTSNNMMAVVSFGRGANICLGTKPNILATAGLQANALTDASAVADKLVVASYETKELDITHLIAGGGGALQNEFDTATGNVAQGQTTLLVANSLIGTVATDLEGVVPACICVSGNNTTAGLQNTVVHQIVVEQEVSFVDFIGGMSPADVIE